MSTGLGESVRGVEVGLLPRAAPLLEGAAREVGAQRLSTVDLQCQANGVTFTSTDTRFSASAKRLLAGTCGVSVRMISGSRTRA